MARRAVSLTSSTLLLTNIFNQGDLNMKATKNWVYGVASPGPDIETIVSEAVFSAHKYRNTLCQLELEKRKRHYDILRKHAPNYLRAEQAVTEAETQLGRCRDAIQEQRVKQRTKKPTGVSTLIAQADECKRQLKDLRAELKQAKLDAYSDKKVIAAMDENTAQHKEECKQAKESSGLYWGTEAIVKQACASFASGAPPRFKRYDGTGQLAVQLQGGLDCANADKYNTLCYLGEQNGKTRDCYIRIGSDGRQPIFAKVPIVFHRPLPTGNIKWAFLERRKMANRTVWKIRLTIESEVDKPEIMPGEVAIHLGWRTETNGIRSCTWLGSDGRTGTLVLPESHCSDYCKLDAIKSARDNAFNDMVSALREWMKDRELPEHLLETRKTLHSWRSKERLAKLYWEWTKARTEDDEDILNLLNEWRKTDKHRWQNESRLSARVSRRRKHIYRNFVSDMASRYGVVYISKIDAKELTENSTPEDLERDNTLAHRHAKWAAVSELATMFEEKFFMRCINTDSKNMTRQCCNCGEINNPTKRTFQCSGCLKTFDIDANAVANTFARGEASVRSGGLLALVAAQELKEAQQQAKLKKMQDANRGARKAKVSLKNTLTGEP